MHLMRYRPGCWPVRLGVTLSVHFLARFEFLFEDAIGVSISFKAATTTLLRVRVVIGACVCG